MNSTGSSWTNSAANGSPKWNSPGIFGSPAYLALFENERRALDRLLAKDPLRVRNLFKARQKLYDLMLDRYRKDPDPAAATIGPEDFSLGREDLEKALDVVAICRKPSA